MKYLLLLLAIPATVAWAQTLPQQWQQRSEHAPKRWGNSVVVDDLGNVYATGTFRGELDLGGAVGVLDTTFLGMPTAGSLPPLLPLPNGFVAGDVVHVGTTLYFYQPGPNEWNDIIMGPLEYYPSQGALVADRPTANDGDVVGVTSTETLWVWDDDNTAGAWVDTLVDIAQFSSSLASSSIAASAQNIFVVKYDPNGDALWAIAGGGDGFDAPTSIAVDELYNVYVTGAVTDRGNFLGEQIGGEGKLDGFVIALSANGFTKWSRTVGSPENDWATGVLVDLPRNAVYASGSFQDEAIIGSLPPIVPRRLKNRGTFPDIASLEAAILVPDPGDYATVGTQLLWDTANQEWFDTIKEQTLEDGGFEFMSDAFLVQINRTTGQENWVARAGGMFEDHGAGLQIDDDGNVYWLGYALGLVDFSYSPLPTPATPFGVRMDRLGLFRAVFDSTGVPLQVQNLGNQYPSWKVVPQP